MKKIKDNRLEIKLEKGKYTFGIYPDKDMIDAMTVFYNDKELQDRCRASITEDAYFGMFRSMPKKLWARVLCGESIPVERKQIFCINGEFYIQDKKEKSIE